MSGHQHATINDTVYFWFAANDTSGSGGDGATPLYDVREAGAAAGAIPLLSGTPTLLSHANYPAGCYEVAVAATTGNGFAADDTFAVFCTLAIDSQNPTGFVGSCTLTPLATSADIATAQADLDIITGASGVNLLTATQASIDAIETDTSTTIPATIATAQADLDIITGASGVNLLTATQASIDAIEVDTSTTIPATIATAQADLDIITGASGVNLLTATQASIDAIETDTTTDIPALIATAQADLDTLTGSDGATLATSQPNYDAGAPRRNVALSNIPFKLVDSASRPAGLTGASVTVEYAGDSATTWTAGGGTVAEVDDGIYTYDALQAEMNFQTVTFRFSATGADSAEIAISTVA